MKPFEQQVREKKKLFYMCGIDWQHEFEADDPIKIYPSVAALKRDKKCWKECGIVAIEGKEFGWPVKQNLNGPKKGKKRE